MNRRQNMERYYKILGISNNASKEKIKEAYHTKLNLITIKKPI